MGARQKINAAYLNGCLLAAAVVGAAARSGAVFLVALAALAASCLVGGDIRPRGRRR
jgi:hypothetical protein